MVDTFMSDMDRLCSRLHRVGRLFPLRLHGGPALRVHCTCILHRHVNGLQGVLPLDTLLWPWINLGVHSVGRITCPAGGVPPMSMLPPTWIPRTPACLHPAPIQLEDSPPIEIADSQEQEASSPPRRCPLSPPKTSPPRAADSTHLHTAGKTQHAIRAVTPREQRHAPRLTCKWARNNNKPARGGHQGPSPYTEEKAHPRPRILGGGPRERRGQCEHKTKTGADLHMQGESDSRVRHGLSSTASPFGEAERALNASRPQAGCTLHMRRNGQNNGLSEGTVTTTGLKADQGQG